MEAAERQIVLLPVSAVLAAVWGVVALAALLSVGRGGDVVDAVVLLPQILLWAAPGFVYLAAAVGYGMLARAMVRGARDGAALSVGIGIGILATVSQIAGCLGLLASGAAAIGLLAPGWLGLAASLWKRRTLRVEVPRAGLMAWVAVVPAAVLVAAASAPPGWLWESEYGGFDALSYHLQLPQEWMRLGRIVPLEHCVYSYLPGSFEAGVVHIAALTGVGGEGRGGGGFGLLEGTGWRAVSAQFLHAWLAVVAAWLVGRAARSAVAFGGGDEDAGRHAGLLAGVLTLATPWCVVVGSLAYNEMPVVGLGAAALVAALDRGLPAWRRGLLAGVIVGAACGFKPTAMVFLTPGIGVALLATSRPREWAWMVLAGAAAGAAMLSPWMVRNWLACGNPLFPFASGVFGTGHWTAEQVGRYMRGHAFPGTLAERLWLLVGPDAGAPVSRGGVVRSVERWRGVLNPQYGVLFPAAAGAVVGVCGVVRPARRAAAILGAMLVLGAAAWMATTHLQSRFLLPLVAPACVAVALSIWGGVGRGDGAGGRVRWWIGALLAAWQSAVLVAGFMRQREGGPNEATVAGPALFTGEFLGEPSESAAAMVNRGLPAGSCVYLLGDAGPFYLDAGLASGTRPEVVWHTTWDASPLGDAIREAASGASGDEVEAGVVQVVDGPEAWTAGLRRRGITHVLVNYSELGRYGRSGWYDPDVTPERVTAWVRSLGEPLVTWERTRQALYAIPDAGSAGGAGDE